MFNQNNLRTVKIKNHEHFIKMDIKVFLEDGGDFRLSEQRHLKKKAAQRREKIYHPRLQGHFSFFKADEFQWSGKVTITQRESCMKTLQNV